jgi:hypothetical protein
MKELYAALAAAQAELRPAPFDSVNPHFRSKFASLASVVATLRPVLAKHGLGFHQRIVDNDGLCAITTIFHSSGQSIDLCGPSFRPGKPDVHGTAAATTYARRIGLSTAFGCVADEDTDGNDALAQEPPTVPEDPRRALLLDEAANAASTSLQAYADYWQSISLEERRLIGAKAHEELKTMAKGKK